MLATAYKAVFNRLLHPPAAFLARAGVHPSALTLATPILTTVNCISFLRHRSVGIFCFTMLVVGCLDALDGAVARAGRKASAVGAYLDAMCDRYVDIIIALTVAVYSGYWLLIMIVLTGGLLVSYAKARAAMEAPVDNLEWPDLMERTERGLIFLGGFTAGALIPWRPLGRDLFWWTLAALSVLIHATVVQRMLRAIRFISQRRLH